MARICVIDPCRSVRRLPVGAKILVTIGIAAR